MKATTQAACMRSSGKAGAVAPRCCGAGLAPAAPRPSMACAAASTSRTVAAPAAEPSLFAQLKASTFSAGVAALVLGAGAPAFADEEVATMSAPAASSSEVFTIAAAEPMATPEVVTFVMEAAPPAAAESVPAPAPAVAQVAAAAPVAPQRAAAMAEVAETAEPAPAATPAAAAQPVVSLPLPPRGSDLQLSNLPKSAIPDLVSALVQNESFIAALVNNEAFLDRLAGDNIVVQELERRKSSVPAVAARRELAQELVRRLQLLEELKTRGPDAVIALANTARAVIDAVDVGGPSGKGGLISLETAVELLEDSEELMMAVEGKPMDADVSFSGSQKFKTMEGSVAATEQRLQQKMSQASIDGVTLKAERSLQAAVKELFTTSDAIADSKPQADIEKDKSINGAFDQVVLAVAELQRAYSNAVSTAMATAESKVVGVEQAALQGLEKSQVLVGQKVVQLEQEAVQAAMGLEQGVERTVDALVEAVPAPVPRPVDNYQRAAVGLSAAGLISYIGIMWSRAAKYPSSLPGSPAAGGGPVGAQPIFVAPEPASAAKAEKAKAATKK